MLPDFDASLRSLAEVIVRVGVNLQPGQPLLVTDPYDLQGVHPGALPLAAAIKAIAGADTRILHADPAHLRACVAANDLRSYTTQVAAHTVRLRVHLKRQGAFLFLTGSAPHLFAGLPADRLARFNAVKWRLFGPVIQRLVHGAGQWTLAPAPSADWADAAYADLPAGNRLPALWRTVFESTRVAGPNGRGSLSPDSAPSGHNAPPTSGPIDQWIAHLASLSRRRDELNAARHRRIRYVGPGTDLTLDLPRAHTWCTAQLVSKAGVPFVANLPTEEVFTAPHKGSAIGTVRVSRPVVHGGTVIDGIELEFRGGRVVGAKARAGQDALHHLLATDNGAARVGEVAIVPALRDGRSLTDRLYHHTLLDENSANHLALGNAYRFCSRALLPLTLNRSQVHLDLPLDATVELS